MPGTEDMCVYMYVRMLCVCVYIHTHTYVLFLYSHNSSEKCYDSYFIAGKLWIII